MRERRTAKQRSLRKRTQRAQPAQEKTPTGENSHLSCDLDVWRCALRRTPADLIASRTDATAHVVDEIASAITDLLGKVCAFAPAARTTGLCRWRCVRGVLRQRLRFRIQIFLLRSDPAAGAHVRR
jgi:hypothetical protein